MPAGAAMVEGATPAVAHALTSGSIKHGNVPVAPLHGAHATRRKVRRTLLLTPRKGVAQQRHSGLQHARSVRGSQQANRALTA